MNITKIPFGRTTDGKETFLYTLENKNGTIAKVSDFGAVLVELHTKDRKGNDADIVLGYSDVRSYEKNKPGFGAVIGRHANRIEGAEFELNGKRYELEKNDGNNNLHSGSNGYQKRLWDVQIKEEKTEATVSFFLLSPDGDQGFPGTLHVKVSYTLNEKDELILHYEAVSDQDTIINMTNHSYFNLAGHESGDVLDQFVFIDSDEITLADAESIPHGEYLKVAGTPMDFNQIKPIGKDIACDFEQLIFGRGYDHNWVLKTDRKNISLVARMEDQKSGRGLEIYTDLPGMQFYTANFLDGTERGKNGVIYQKRQGACFETQYFPNAIHVPKFPQPVIKANELWQSTTVFHFYLSSSFDD